MSRRLLESFGVTATVAAVFVLLRLSAPATVGAQQASKPAGGAAMTPWGEPDLQGIWTRDSDVPLQRNAKYANREFLKIGRAHV